MALIANGHRNFIYHRVEIDKAVNNAFFYHFTDEYLSSLGITVVHHNDVKDFPPKITATPKWNESLLNDGVDLLMGGSPCQGVSIAGLQLGLEDPRSSLFHEFIRVRGLLKPRNFLLENVPMKKEFLDIFNSHVGRHPVIINSSSFSAQDRKRLYWTDIHFEPVTFESPLTVEDILEEEVEDKYFIEPQKAVEICDREFQKRKIAYIGADSAANRIYSIHGKSVTLVANGGGMGAKTGLYAIPCLSPDRVEKRQNGRRFKPPHSKFYTLTSIDRHGIVIGNYIRRLTPVECERLQGWPDNVTLGAGKDTQRYKICGNGWTLGVIQHILKGLK